MIGLMMHTHRQGRGLFVGQQVGFRAIADLPGPNSYLSILFNWIAQYQLKSVVTKIESMTFVLQRLMRFSVVTMFVDDSTHRCNGKTYRRVLLRNAYRTQGKVRHDTLANLSHCTDEEIEALKLALKHKRRLAELGALEDNIEAQQGSAVGAAWVLNQLAKHLGITQALGHHRLTTLARWLVFATLIEQGSRLSAVRLAQRHAVCDILNLERFNEDDLYQAMDWLAQRQNDIEHEKGSEPSRTTQDPPLGREQSQAKKTPYRDERNTKQ